MLGLFNNGFGFFIKKIVLDYIYFLNLKFRNKINVKF